MHLISYVASLGLDRLWVMIANILQAPIYLSFVDSIRSTITRYLFCHNVPDYIVLGHVSSSSPKICRKDYDPFSCMMILFLQ